MHRQIAFDIHPAYRTFQVWDGNLDSVETYHEVNDRTIGQGFTSRLQRSINFFKIGDHTHLTVEMFYANKTVSLSKIIPGVLSYQ